MLIHTPKSVPYEMLDDYSLYYIDETFRLAGLRAVNIYQLSNEDKEKARKIAKHRINIDMFQSTIDVLKMVWGV